MLYLFLLAVLGMSLPQSAHAEEPVFTWAQSCVDFANCTRQEATRLDDGTSPADVVAAGVVTTCNVGSCLEAIGNLNPYALDEFKKESTKQVTAIVLQNRASARIEAANEAAFHKGPFKPFHGYQCTKDCSGHIAGYEWAKARGIDNPDDCDGKSKSFIEGCRAWAAED